MVQPLIFQTLIIWSNIIHSLKYQRSTTLDRKDIEIRKSEFVKNLWFIMSTLFTLNSQSWKPQNCWKSGIPVSKYPWLMVWIVYYEWKIDMSCILLTSLFSIRSSRNQDQLFSPLEFRIYTGLILIQSFSRFYFSTD